MRALRGVLPRRAGHRQPADRGPAELEFLRDVVGWPALAVDPYVERHALDGFRLPNATDADPYLGSLWSLAG
jgi:hypothetical protein